ncbi:UNVERIFIED_CONTAM: hypothetical protein Sindi_3055700 [Sesamum indicum]
MISSSFVKLTKDLVRTLKPLLSKIDARIAGWEGMSLSYAGRVQIIKTVLSALSLYWASAFILPKAVIKEVEKRLRLFLWKGTSGTGYAKVAWKDVCKTDGGRGTGYKRYWYTQPSSNDKEIV